jgi:hypothetical protein
MSGPTAVVDRNRSPIPTTSSPPSSPGARGAREATRRALMRQGAGPFGGCDADHVRRKLPRLIHNLWIRLKKRSKAIERTCLVEGDRPYSPSLDGGLQRRQSTAGRKASRSNSDGRRRKLQTPNERRSAALFSIGIPKEKKVERFRKNLWTPETTGTRYRDPAAGSPRSPRSLKTES